MYCNPTRINECSFWLLLIFSFMLSFAKTIFLLRKLKAEFSIHILSKYDTKFIMNLKISHHMFSSTTTTIVYKCSFNWIFFRSLAKHPHSCRVWKIFLAKSNQESRLFSNGTHTASVCWKFYALCCTLYTWRCSRALSVPCSFATLTLNLEIEYWTAYKCVYYDKNWPKIY